MYLGPRPLSDLYTSKSTLKSILNVTGSQCKDLRTGVICSDFLISFRKKKSNIVKYCNF